MSQTADARSDGGARATDPRTIITPDAFSVAPELLGLPLAHPWRRAAAILVDLILVAILANARAVFFAFAAGVFVFWLATRGLSGAPSAGRRAARVTLGCLGAFALTVGALAVWATLFVDSDRIITELETVAGEEVAVSATTARELVRLVTAPDSASAAVAAERAVESLLARDVAPDEIRSALEDLQSEMDEEATSGRALRALDAALARSEAEERTGATDTITAAAPIDSLLAAFSRARARDDSAAMARVGSLLGSQLASEELEAAEARARREEGRADRLRDELTETERTLEEERNRGILASVYAVLDDVGLGLGWAGLYFTFFIGRWEGRTPGKRLLGIRAVRLDGRPIGYWVSFERYGGYAASLFTGLEGFARLIWDPNRQALEDKLAGTVVLRDTPEARRRVAEVHERTAAAGG